ASFLTFDSIYNWNSINSLSVLAITTGDNGITPSMHVSFAQDFMKNNRNLTAIDFSNGVFRASGIRDTTFKISRFKSDWNTYFTNLWYISLQDDQWDHEDLSALTHLSTFVLTSTTTDHTNGPNNSPIPLSSTVIDNIIIQVAAGAGQHISDGIILMRTGG